VEMQDELEAGGAEDPDRLAREHAMTSHLVDLVLIQLYSLTDTELGEVRSGAEVEEE
jgi:hypothetical protein